jgi:hypothetical protein
MRSGLPLLRLIHCVLISSAHEGIQHKHPGRGVAFDAALKANPARPSVATWQPRRRYVTLAGIRLWAAQSALENNASGVQVQILHARSDLQNGSLRLG